MADDDELLVTISGPAFSMLLYENARIHDQIGFLLGEILIYVTKKVTDTEDRDVDDIKYHINIKNVLAYPLGEPFYNTIGKIDKNKLNNFLKDNVKNVVGWYHYRQNFRIVASMRDKFLHSELSNFCSNTNRLQTPENFIFCILTSTVSEKGGTHKFKHVLMQKKTKVFKPVTLKINNLGADATKPDGTDYKPTPTESSCESDAFDKVYEEIKNELKKTSGVQSVTLIQRAAEQLLEKLIPDVAKSDQKVSQLEEELYLLRNRYFHEEFIREVESRINQDTEDIALEEQLRQMEVESKSSIVSEPKSPESVEIFDPPKSPVALSNTSSNQISKLESGGGERIFDTASTDPDILIIEVKESSKSQQGKKCKARTQKEDTGTSEQARPKQRADQVIKSSSAKCQYRGLQHSPNHEPDDT